MSLLKGLFGQSQQNPAEDPFDPLAAQFDEEFSRAIRRFGIVTGYGDAWSLALADYLMLKKRADFSGRSDFLAFWSGEYLEENGVKLFLSAEAQSS